MHLNASAVVVYIFSSFLPQRINHPSNPFASKGQFKWRTCRHLPNEIKPLQ